MFTQISTYKLFGYYGFTVGDEKRWDLFLKMLREGGL